MKYKVGDWVEIRSDLVYDRRYGSEVFVEGMNRFSGRIATIAAIDKNERYYLIDLDGGDYYWTDEMIEGLADGEPKHMTAEDIISWFQDATTGELMDVFGTQSLHEVFYGYQAKDITRKIEEYMAASDIEEEAQEYCLTFGERPDAGAVWSETHPVMWVRRKVTFADGTVKCGEPRKVYEVTE